MEYTGTIESDDIYDEIDVNPLDDEQPDLGSRVSDWDTAVMLGIELEEYVEGN